MFEKKTTAIMITRFCDTPKYLKPPYYTHNITGIAETKKEGQDRWNGIQSKIEGPIPSKRSRVQTRIAIVRLQLLTRSQIRGGDKQESNFPSGASYRTSEAPDWRGDAWDDCNSNLHWLTALALYMATM